MKLIHIKCNNTASVTAANSISIFDAFFKLILSGVTDPEAYTSDPICGAFCAGSAMSLTHSGDTTVYPVVTNGVGDFTVDYGEFKIRCLSRKTGTATYAGAFVTPYVENPYFYNSSLAPVLPPKSTTSYLKSVSLPAGTTDVAKNHYLRYPKANAAMNMMVMIDVERGLILISNDTTGSHFSETERALHSILWQKSGDDSFFSASFLTAFTNPAGTCFSLLDSSFTRIPVSLMTSLGPVASTFGSNLVRESIVHVLTPKDISSSTAKPVFGLKAYYLDKEFDFSDAFLAVDYSNVSEVASTVFNNGETYDTYGHFLLRRV